MKPVDSDVHVLLPLTEGPEPVERPPLVVVLEVLQERHVYVEQHVLVPEALVGGAVGPDQRDAADHSGHKVMSSPPALDMVLIILYFYTNRFNILDQSGSFFAF